MLHFYTILETLIAYRDRHAAQIFTIETLLNNAFKCKCVIQYYI